MFLILSVVASLALAKRWSGRLVGWERAIELAAGEEHRDAKIKKAKIK